MVYVLASKWWAVLLRGLAALLFGALAFAWPGVSLTALVFLFGAYAFADGVFNVAAAFGAPRGYKNWWALLAEGLCGVAAGVLTFVWPGVTALALLYLIAAWAVVTGALEVAAAVRLRKVIAGEWLLALGGLLSVLFGVLLAAWPATGALAVLWLIGAYAFAMGVVLTALAFRLRRLGSNLLEVHAVA